MSTRTVSVELQAKVGQYTSSMDRAAKSTTAVDRASADAADRSRELARRMQIAGGVAGGALILGVKQALAAASDLGETTSKVGVIFGDAAGQIEAFADTADTALGQSKQQAMDAASTFATFGKSAGLTGKQLGDFSIEMTTLASDLASFNNTSPEEAIEALGAALRGETEPIRRYGVMLDDASLRQEALAQGLIKTTKEALTPQQKVLAAQSAILKQTSDAQGDFARTADGAANQQRILAAQLQNTKAELGQNLLPIMQSTLGVVNDVVGAFNDLPEPVQQAAAMTALLSTAALIAAPRLLAVVETVKALRAASAAANSSVGGLSRTTIAATAGLAALTATVAYISEGILNSSQSLKTADELLAEGLNADNLQDYRDQISQLSKQTGDWENTSVISLRAVQLGWTDLWNRAAGEGGVYEDWKNKQAELEESLRAYDWAIQDVAAANDVSAESLAKHAEEAGLVGKTYQEIKQGLQRWIIEQQTSTVANERAATAWEVLADKVSSAEDKVRAYADGLSTLDRGYADVQSANDAYQASLDAVTASLEENGRTLNDGTEKGRANRAVLRDMADRTRDLATAVYEQTGNQDKANGKIEAGRQALIKQGRRFGLTKTAAEDYATKLGLIPGELITEAVFNSGQAQRDIDAYKRVLRAIELGDLRSDEQEFQGRDPRRGGRGRASGGSIVAGQTYSVNELPATEWIRLDRGGLSGSIRASKPADAGGRGRGDVNLYSSVEVHGSGPLTERDVRRAVNQGLADFSREWERL